MKIKLTVGNWLDWEVDLVFSYSWTYVLLIYLITLVLIKVIEPIYKHRVNILIFGLYMDPCYTHY